MLAGTLVPTASGRDVALPTDRVLLRHGDVVRMVSARNHVVLWELAHIETDVRILDVTTDDLLLWVGGSTDDPRVLCIDLEQGRERWTTPPLHDYVHDLLRPDLGGRTIMPNGLPFHPEETLPLADARSVCLVRRTGPVVIFERETGRFRGAVERTLTQVHDADLRPWGICLAGIGFPIGERAELQPMLIALDPETGDVLHSIKTEPEEEIVWMRTDDAAGLVTGTTRGIGRFDGRTGDVLWFNRTPPCPG